MPMLMTTGAMMTCSFGVAPSSLNILPANRVMAGNMPAATIADNVPGLNVPPFGMCNSIANPAVAAATAAALGALTPMPCMPVPAGPWVPGVPTTMIGGVPALNDTCKLMCAWAGVIQFTAPGQVTVQV
ncbi:DUF4280 domain-containing protein [Sphingomonas sp. R-74633]|uniref:DUF4280 domain-containing protein n=1 Tax=Sphingomonas sp. R-74633 TaxID=2751188 RepID=UPI0015D17A13|nr:DUF4280 domain-containing protein [Sphingomonas sp. R-74633]NYT43197.1 DUF4280 domain-containing protein [Sphingomonas sp. R-74633]